MLFGDGAGAVVLSPRPRTGEPHIIDFAHEIDGSGGPALCMPAGGSRLPASHETVDQRLHYVKQDGQAVFKFAVRKTEEICRRVLERNGIDPAPSSICSCRTRRTGASSRPRPSGSACPTTRWSSTSRCTATRPRRRFRSRLPMRSARTGLKKGDLVLLASVGAGFTVGAVLLRWAI